MKSQLSFFQKVGFALNVFFAICLLIAYILPFIPPKFSAFLSILNLGLPIFILINIGFAFYWLLKLKLHFFVSALLIVGGYSYFNKIIVFNDNSSVEIKNSLKVMSYNVRLFNFYNWIEKTEVGKKISDFIKVETPDIVAFQDFY